MQRSHAPGEVLLRLELKRGQPHEPPVDAARSDGRFRLAQRGCSGDAINEREGAGSGTEQLAAIDHGQTPEGGQPKGNYREHTLAERVKEAPACRLGDGLTSCGLKIMNRETSQWIGSVAISSLQPPWPVQ